MIRRRRARSPRSGFPATLWPRLPAWLLAAAVSGCAGGLPETHYYVLLAPHASAADVAASDSEGLAIGVESFSVDPPYDQDRLVYRPDPSSTEVGFYTYHRWASPLGRLVAVALGEGLRRTPGVASIEPTSSIGSYTAWLRGRVKQFEEVDSTSTRAARIVIEVELVDTEGKTLWQETLTGSGNSGGGEAIGHFNRAFEGLLDQARASLAAALG